jgi:geranylgeranyl pyrophosphate synthase
MKNGKLTLPWLLLLQHTSPAHRHEIGELILRGEPAERAALVTGNSVLPESLATVRQYIARAEAGLADLPADVYSQSLTGLLHFIAAKTQSLLKEEVVA